MQSKIFRRYALGLCVLLSVEAIGCSRAPRKSNFSRAHEAMQQALTYWKAGKTPTDIKSDSKLIVGDSRWEKGVKLVDFQVDASPKDDGRNYHFNNRISVVDSDGQVIEEQSKFIVATDPVVTVFREDHEAE
jgi:hypothetical protein